MLENDLFASISQSELKVCIWNVNHYTPLKQIYLNSDLLSIPDKNCSVRNKIWDMIKYSDGYLAVLYGNEGHDTDKFKRIFSIIDYNKGEVKSSFNFQTAMNDEIKILKFNNDEILLISDNGVFRIYIKDPLNSIYEKYGLHICSYHTSIENNIIAAYSGPVIFIIDVSNKSKEKIIKKLHHDEFYYKEDNDTKQLKQHINWTRKVILVDDEYIVSTDDSGHILVWLK